MFKNLGLIGLIGLFIISMIIVILTSCGEVTKTTATTTTTIPAGASITGIVNDKDGNPTSGVTVSLRSTSALASSVIAFSTETTTTGASGSFEFSNVSNGTYNVQADKSNQYKLIKQNIVISGGVGVNLGTLTLAQTGAISGNAFFIDKTSHLGIDVFIPGTSFTAKTAASGAYSILYIPEGTFEVYAMYTAYQTASEEGVTVNSASTTTVPNLMLEPQAGGTYGGVTFEVRDMFTGAKLPTVEVTIGYVEKTTDTNGQVTFDKVWAASQSFTASKEGYQLYTDSVTIIANAVTLKTIWMTSNTFSITSWGSSGTGDGQFSNVFGIAVDSNKNVYITDTDWNTIQRVQKFNSSGSFLAKWGSLGTAEGQFITPQGLAVDDSNNVYVADASNSRIQKFNNSGTFLLKFGSVGTGEGQLSMPYDVAVDSSGSIFVADSENNRIQKFDSSGNFLSKFGSQGSGDGQFGSHSPKFLAIDTNGNIYVVDSANSRIEKFDSSGNFLTKWGSLGSDNGQFGSSSTYGKVRGIFVDSNGNVYVADTGNDRIQKFDSSGNFLTKWGTSGTAIGQFNAPSDIAVDSNGNVYVSEWGNTRIQKFSQ